MIDEMYVYLYFFFAYFVTSFGDLVVCIFYAASK